jgi:hypothetical protein
MYFWLLFLTTSIWAHQTSLTNGGRPLYWPNKNVPLVLQTNNNDINSTTARNVILNSMNEWNAASSAKVTSANSSVNELKFSSDFSMFGSGVIGVTELSFNSSGAIQRASIILNDNYNFTSTPGFYGGSTIFLGDVVTHELGHLFGLGHSEVLNSSMFFSSFSGQSTLAADDASGIRSKYDQAQDHGIIRGFVQGGNSIGVLGAHVQAISRRTGEVVGVVTDENGRFEIAGLAFPDTYYLYVSSVKNPASLPGYFANVQDKFCPGPYVGSFFTACGSQNSGFPTPIQLSEGTKTQDVGVVSISCSLRTNSDYSFQKLQETFSPMELWSYGETDDKDRAFVGFSVPTSSSAWSTPEIYKVNLRSLNTSNNQRYLNIRLVAQPFGNLMEYELRLFQLGSPSPVIQKTYSNVTGTYSTDLFYKYPLSSNSSLNDFEIEIRSRRLTNFLTAQTFSSPALFTSSTHLPHLLLLSTSSFEGLNEIFENTSVNMSDNSTCLEAPFTYRVNKTQAPTENAITSGGETAAGASCGTLDPPSGPGSGGSSFMLVAIGFLLTLLSGRVAKISKNFLS